MRMTSENSEMLRDRPLKQNSKPNANNYEN